MPSPKNPHGTDSTGNPVRFSERMLRVVASRTFSRPPATGISNCPMRAVGIGIPGSTKASMSSIARAISWQNRRRARCASR